MKVIKRCAGMVLLLSVAIGVSAQATALTGSLTVDNGFSAFISTDDSINGTSICNGDNWGATYNLGKVNLTPGVKNYLHVKASDWGVIAGFLGSFKLSDTGFVFNNGTQSLVTNASDWKVGTNGFGTYNATVSIANGKNGCSPWGTRPNISNDAVWIWTNGGHDTNTTRYFSTEITAVPEPGTIVAALSVLAPAGLLFRRKRA